MAWAKQLVLVGGAAVFASVADRVVLEVVALVVVVMVPAAHLADFSGWVLGWKVQQGLWRMAGRD